MKPIRNYIQLIFALVIIMVGCTSVQKAQTSLCISPNDVSGYQPDLERPDLASVPIRKTMVSWWQPQLNRSQAEELLHNTAYDVVFRSKDEIWIGYFNINPGRLISCYRIDTGEIKNYEIFDPDGKITYAEDFYLTRDGNLWARLSAKRDKLFYSLLARYDTQKDEFVIVRDQDSWLTFPNSIEDSRNGRPQPFLGEMPDGKLAIVINGGIYLYDPVTNRAVQALKNGLDVNSIVISNDGYIWFVTKKDLSVRSLNPKDGIIFDYGPPPGIAKDDPLDLLSLVQTPLMLDDAGRVWVADFGWLEPDPIKRYIWHPIARSPLFISIYDPDLEYEWGRPWGGYQFSDGNIWFWGGEGIFQFDLQKNSWCWKASESGPLVEDGNGNLWLVGTKQIYKYKLRPIGFPSSSSLRMP